MAVALYTIEGDVVLIKRRRIGAVELCVDVRGILGVTRQRLSDLSPLNSAIVEIAVFQRHPARLRTGISKQQLKGRLKLKKSESRSLGQIASIPGRRSRRAARRPKAVWLR